MVKGGRSKGRESGRKEDRCVGYACRLADGNDSESTNQLGSKFLCEVRIEPLWNFLSNDGNLEVLAGFDWEKDIL